MNPRNKVIFARGIAFSKKIVVTLKYMEHQWSQFCSCTHRKDLYDFFEPYVEEDEAVSPLTSSYINQSIFNPWGNGGFS